MKKLLVMLVLVVLVLSWHFILSPSTKVQLTDPAKVLQGLSLALKYKLAVREYWLKNGELPAAEDWQQAVAEPQVDISRSLVTAIKVGERSPGSITVYFSNKDVINVAADIDGSSINLVPFIVDQKLDWSCFGDMQEALMPGACQYRQ